MARRDLASGPIFRIDDIYPNYEEAMMRMVMMVTRMMMMMMMMRAAKKCQTMSARALKSGWSAVVAIE